MAAPVFEILEYTDGSGRTIFRVRRRGWYFFWEFVTRTVNHNGECREVIYEWIDNRRGAERYIEDELEKYKRSIRKRIHGT